MTSDRQQEIRAILADHVATQSELKKALHAVEHIDGRSFVAIVHAMVHCEKRQAEEIDRLYMNAHPWPRHEPLEAIQCEDCQQWLVGEYCQCTQRDRLMGQLEASLERMGR